MHKCMCTCVYSFKGSCATWSDTIDHVPETRGSVIQESLGSCQSGESKRLPKQHRLLHCSQSLKVTPSCWWQHVVQTQRLEESSWIGPRNLFLKRVALTVLEGAGRLPVEKMPKILLSCTTYTWQQWPRKLYPKRCKSGCGCGCLSENWPHMIIYLNVWSLVGGNVWGRIKRCGFDGVGVPLGLEG